MGPCSCIADIIIYVSTSFVHIDFTAHVLIKMLFPRRTINMECPLDGASMEGFAKRQHLKHLFWCV